ncbi:MAG: hypothetical protein RSF88_03170 [Lachnospiraceae bacterium]
MKKIKTLCGLMVALVVMLNAMLGGHLVVQAAETTSQEERTGYKQLICIDMEEEAEQSQEVILKYDKYKGSKWDKYSSDYFYKQLRTEEKILYDALYEVCMAYLTTSVDAIQEDGKPTGWMEKVTVPSGITKAETEKIVQLFYTNNPQFYFINEYYGYGGESIFLGIYSDFVSGAVRATATDQLFSKIDSWTTQMKNENTRLDQEKKAHDLIIENTLYQFGKYNQSCAGVFIEGKSVCAGYAEAFALLCNGVGIPTISVTSAEHEWNLIELYGEWYNVDCTWDDGNPGCYDIYFNKSDATINDAAHTIESIWNNFTMPKCMSDTVTMKGTYWEGRRCYVDGQPQSNVFYAPIRENPDMKWYYFAYSTDDISAGTKAYEYRTGWLRDEKNGKLHFAFPENGLLMADMWSSDSKYYFKSLDLAIGKFVANDGYTYFSYSEKAVINGKQVTGVVQSGWVIDEVTGDLYYCFPENNRMARGIQLGNYKFADSGKCLNP